MVKDTQATGRSILHTWPVEWGLGFHALSPRLNSIPLRSLHFCTEGSNVTAFLFPRDRPGTRAFVPPNPTHSPCPGMFLGLQWAGDPFLSLGLWLLFTPPSHGTLGKHKAGVS